MLTKTDAPGGDVGAIETGGGADPGLVAVGTDDVASLERPAVGLDGGVIGSVPGEPTNDRLPGEEDAKLDRAVEQKLMEGPALDATTFPGVERDRRRPCR